MSDTTNADGFDRLLEERPAEWQRFIENTDWDMHGEQPADGGPSESDLM